MFRLLSAALLTVNASFAQSPILGVDPGSGPVASQFVVSGIVLMAAPSEDVPLPSDLRISVDCHHGEMYDGGSTTLSGGFNFTMKADPGSLNAGDICTLEAKAFGYDSTTARFPIRQPTGIVNVGTVEIHRNVSGDALARNKEHAAKTVSATSLKAPPSAVKLFDRGSRSLQQGKFADAAKDFESAVKIYPDYAESWLNLGRARAGLGSPGIARDAFLRAAELDPQMAGPPEELGLLAAGQNDLLGAAKYLDESLRLDPDGSYRACYSDAVVNMMLKRYDVAERSARAALRFGDTGPQARVNFVLGMALLARGNNAEAKERLLRYLQLTPKAPERDQIMKELSRLEQLDAGK